MIINKTKRPRWVENQIEMSEYVGQRKHSSQMSESEKSLVIEKLKSVKAWFMSGHALDRINEKGINATLDDVISTIYNANIIEYKIDYNSRSNRCDERVVLRSRAIANEEYNLNVVYSITNKSIVTVWLNHVEDKHDTLDWSIYSEGMKVFPLY